ncbi:hypothetical protein HNY73_012952 [Argiope bruennichi]|uniref:Uncharacterized protein n=1 Tax=Argiope bruennichi TaxID=94029 RepID=A0A8T0EYD4_ARGBR|nr:hypothetical protein HNY73_012952 [Argiope bruennichi]
MGMLPQDILGAATGVGLALFIALSAIICKYYSRTRKERMILYSPPRRPSQDRRQKRLMHMREASAMAALPPQQQVSGSVALSNASLSFPNKLPNIDRKAHQPVKVPEHFLDLDIYFFFKSVRRCDVWDPPPFLKQRKVLNVKGTPVFIRGGAIFSPIANPDFGKALTENHIITDNGSPPSLSTT